MNYILTYCSGYPSHIFSNFIDSFEKTHDENTTLVLFTQKEDVKKHELRDKRNIKIKIVKPEFHPQTWRYIAYKNFLMLLRGNDIGRILLCDSRDVLFQGDVFDFDFNSLKRYPEQPDIDLYFTLECGYIGECDINKKWLQAYQKEVPCIFNQLLFQRISCSGATIGNHWGMMNYVGLMTKLILDSPKAQEGKEFRDQALHNHLIYNIHKAGIKTGFLDHKDGLVHHVAWGYPRGTTKIVGDQVVNHLGKPAKIIHLYDRNYEFFSQFKSLNWCKDYKLDFYKK